MKMIAPLVAVVAFAIGGPATAAVTINDYALSFTTGAAVIQPTPAGTPGEYQDNFTFTLDDPATFSGALVTQQLRDISGNVLSNLDFGNSLGGILLDGTDIGFGFSSLGLDLELLPAAALLAGEHTLTVNYTVTVADATSVAGYLGLLSVGGAVPAIPEPGTWALLLLGFGTLGAALRRRGPAVRVSFS